MHVERCMNILIPGFETHANIVLKDKVNRSELDDMLSDKADKQHVVAQEDRVTDIENRFDELELNHSEFSEEMRGRMDQLVEQMAAVAAHKAEVPEPTAPKETIIHVEKKFGGGDLIAQKLAQVGN